MIPNNIKLEFDGTESDREKNFKERIWFIKYWVNYMKCVSDSVWSEQQAALIDPQFQHSKSFYKNLEKTEEGRKILERLKEMRIKRK